MAASPISSPLPFSMASRPSRPLPPPPGRKSPRSYLLYRISIPCSPFPSRVSPLWTQWTEPSCRRGTGGGTLLHKGFYDLLALIPTPSPSRILWGTGADPPPDAIAGPRYEDFPESNNAPSVNFAPPVVSLPSPSPVSSKKARRISKDMVSKPTGFMCVHDHSTSPIS
jgi:protein-serine/threonine kinase